MGLYEIASLKTLPGLIMGYTVVFAFMFAALKGRFPRWQGAQTAPYGHYDSKNAIALLEPFRATLEAQMKTTLHRGLLLGLFFLGGALFWFNPILGGTFAAFGLMIMFYSALASKSKKFEWKHLFFPYSGYKWKEAFTSSEELAVYIGLSMVLGPLLVAGSYGIYNTIRF